jgi:hypothetical protein
LVSYILLLFYIGIIVYPAIPLIDYALNYHYYAEEVCINKDKPEMHCNGQCHLKKEIKKIYDEETTPNKKKSLLPELKLKEYTQYNFYFIKIEYFNKLLILNISDPFINNSLCEGYKHPILRPPPSYSS